MAFAVFLTVVIFGSIVSVVLGVTTGIAGVNFLMGEDKERIDLAQEYTIEEAHSLGIQNILVDCNAEITVKHMCDSTHGVLMKLLESAGIRSEETVSNICSTMLHIVVVLLGFVTIAKEWNYDISAFVASLGIGSLAVAFAAKDALANVFGSLIIILDKPFQNGEWIMANGTEGVVEKISFRSTCLRTFLNELVYIPNSLLSNTPIVNYSRREKRRISFVLGLTYSTTHDQMVTVIEKIKAYLQAQEDLHTDDIRVHFAEYADSSLNIRITCYTKTTSGMTYLDIVQRINLSLMKIMEEVGVSCAFPSTSVYFETPIKNELVNAKNLAETNNEKG